MTFNVCEREEKKTQKNIFIKERDLNYNIIYLI